MQLRRVKLLLLAISTTLLLHLLLLPPLTGAADDQQEPPSPQPSINTPQPSNGNGQNGRRYTWVGIRRVGECLNDTAIYNQCYNCGRELESYDVYMQCCFRDNSTLSACNGEIDDPTD